MLFSILNVKIVPQMVFAVEFQKSSNTLHTENSGSIQVPGRLLIS